VHSIKRQRAGLCIHGMDAGLYVYRLKDYRARFEEHPDELLKNLEELPNEVIFHPTYIDSGGF